MDTLVLSKGELVVPHDQNVRSREHRRRQMDCVPRLQPELGTQIPRFAGDDRGHVDQLRVGRFQERADALTGARDTKHGAGAVGILTNGMVDRQKAYEILVTYALSPVIASEFWSAAPTPSNVAAP